MRTTLRPRRRRALQVEPLESMTLLSGLGTTAVLLARPTAAAISQAAAFPTAVNLTLRGFFAYVRQNPDTGTTYYFFANANVPGLGITAVSGAITTPGFVASGQATGSLTLYSGRGTVSMTIAGPTQPGFAPLPTQVRFTVTGATGFLRFITGSGTLTLGLTPTPGNTATRGSGTVVMTFREPKPTV